MVSTWNPGELIVMRIALKELRASDAVSRDMLHKTIIVTAILVDQI